LRVYLQDLDRLFNVGLDILTNLIRLHRDNVLLLSYLIDDSHDAACAYGLEGDHLLSIFLDGAPLSERYEKVARYYLDSGWPDRAQKILEKLLQLDPENQFALEAMRSLEAKQVA